MGFIDRNRCSHCGNRIFDNPFVLDDKISLCTKCVSDPWAVIDLFLGLAQAGHKDLLPLKGYRFSGRLGQGGMGAVALVSKLDESEDENQLALKIMLPEAAADERGRALFQREIENNKALIHNNIVKLYNYGSIGDLFFFTLEFCNGGNVTHLMQSEGGRLSIDQAVEIICDVLEGLEYANHATIPYVELADGTFAQGKGLVHRDIKPANILLANHNNRRIAKLADFGLSKAFELAGFTKITPTTMTAGSPWFMARQQANNYRHCTPEVDVWAAAASFYNMITGIDVYPRDFPKNLSPWWVVRNFKPEPIRSRNKSIPEKIAELIDKALDDSYDLHFKSAKDFKQSLLSAV